MDRLRMAGPHLLAALEDVYPGGFALGPEGEAASEPSRRDMTRIRLAVARSMFGRDFAGSRELENFVGRGYGEPSSGRTEAMNLAMLPLQGVGHDCFWLNEMLPRDGMRSMADLLAWDREVHDRTQKANVEEGFQEAPLPYSGTMLWDWARWIEDGKLVYGTLSLAENIVQDEAMHLVQDRLGVLHPTEIRMDPLEDGGAMMVSIPEDQAEEYGRKLRAAFPVLRRMHSERWHAAHAALPHGVCVRDRDDDLGGSTREVIFANAPALGMVRPRSFLADLAALQDVSEAIEACRAAALAEVTAWLDAEHPLPEGLRP